MRLRETDGANGRTADLAATAVVLGIAASMWFGWGQAGPPAGWSLPLAAGSAAGLAATVVAVIASRRHRDGAPSMADPAVRTRYRRVVGAEVAACVLGVACLAAAGRPAYQPAWILLVVGLHFLPLARIFRIPSLFWAGVTASAVAIAAAVTGATSDVRPSTVAGAGGGLACLCCAAWCLRQVASAPWGANEGAEERSVLNA
jgi:hypothetical protein